MRSNVNTFEQTFQQALDQVEKDAKEVGMTITSICRDLGISRATPDRWRKEPPKTVEILTKMQGIVAARREQIAREEASGLHHD
jgi:transposase-like protein